MPTFNRATDSRKRSCRQSRPRVRNGSLMVWCAFLLVILLGMVGLVLDGGLLMAAQRHAQNAADAAATAAALAMLRGESNAAAKTAGTTFVTDADHNNLPEATVAINIPPSHDADSPYNGAANHAEAIVDMEPPTYFIHVLPGFTNAGTVKARAVAGYELVALAKGIIALDPGATPGLKISGQATLKVNGQVYVNSEGGGVDENGEPVLIEANQTNTTVNNNGSLCAEDVSIVGGVNNNGIDNIESPIEGADNPLQANMPPSPDPLIHLETPTTANGVVNVFQGEPQASEGGLALNPGVDSTNYIRNDGTVEEPDEVMVLHPGIYTSIKITGGRVEFVPGIYVLKPAENTSFTLEITGGDVIANGLMFYNTGDNYDPESGYPDNTDYTSSDPPPPPDDPNFGNMKINDSIHMTPLDASTYTYEGVDPDISIFDGMLFYQRRLSDAGMQIEGNSADGQLDGTFYAKWGEMSIDGQGTYNGSFVVGSLKAEGQALMTINPDDDSQPKAKLVFLVE